MNYFRIQETMKRYLDSEVTSLINCYVGSWLVIIGLLMYPLALDYDMYSGPRAKLPPVFQN